MREILFRGKDADNGEWVYGDLIHGKGEQKGHLFIWYETDTFPFVEEAEVILETVGQYTGIPDKNGTKIFEGDIIQSVESGETGEIQYFSEHTAFLIFVRGLNCYLDYLGEVNPNIVKVIGNIWDNPELLEG